MAEPTVERQLWGWWRGVGRGVLLTAAGEPVEVLHPGQSRGGGGPDFRDAVLRLGKALVRGDVEVHLTSQGWRQHRHHHDPGYNRVVLHPVLRCSAPWVATEAGSRVPVLLLHPGEGTARCRGEPAAAGGWLDAWGEERFLEKAAHFRSRLALAEAEPGQVLYAGLLDALGYGGDREGFRRLARRLPLRELEEAGQGREPEERHSLVASRLLRAAGEAGLRPQGRPLNRPERRLEALAHLLVRYGQAGLLAGMAGLLRGVSSPAELEAGLLVGVRRPALLGRERAAAVAVNVLLPFFWAWGEPALVEKALALYCAYPRRGENGVVRQMRQMLGLEASMVGSARREQGLIHLYRTRCLQGLCPGCPLGPLPA